MLKFIKGHMESIDGITIYPIIAFVIFFAFFIGLAVVVLVQRKDYYDKLSQMPMDDGTENDKEKTERHE
jgi:cytochrome c oxidase cbb3-type subunit 4